VLRRLLPSNHWHRLILGIIAGAELFNENNLLVIAWANRKISRFELVCG
jgi:formate/nitrite transporter FocA (FNT family)